MPDATRRGPRQMPAMDKIIDYWRGENPPWADSWYIGFGEPFCFACGWLAPVRDGRKDSWRQATKWLDRAHLHDRAAGGSDEPVNLVPMCHLCHGDMPEFDSRNGALAWVVEHPRRETLFQLWTDSHLRGVDPTRTTTLMRAWASYLDYVRKCQEVA